MDNWNNEQKPDVSVSGQFSGSPYQDQNQNNYDWDMYGQSAGGADSYSQTQNVTDSYNSQQSNNYGQPNSNYSQPGNYGQPNNSYSQPNNNPGQPGGGYGQPNNNYANGYGQPFANYNQPFYQGPGFTPTEMEEPIGVGEWTGLLAIATFLPCIGLILIIVWAFGGTEKKSKSNFCKAYLIICLIKLALYAILFIVYGASLASAISSEF